MSFLLRLLLVLPVTLWAQSGIDLRGKVIDHTTQKPIEYATISLLKAADSSFVTGAVTDSLGIFRMKAPSAGQWIVSADFIGYKKIWFPFTVLESKTPLDVPLIALKDAVKDLEEVVIEGQKDFVQNTIDKQIYNVDKLGVAQGGTAVDVLQNIPSVTIDQEGTPSMRGTNVIVLIDGRPSGISGQSRSAALDQIPSSSIERIEVISNPSAKYDPDGMSGIINVILKKNNKAGYNGNTALTVGDREKYNYSLNLNYRKGKLNLFATYSFNHSKYYGTGSSDRKNIYGDSIYYIRQGQNNDNISDVHMAKVGMDYQVGKNSTYTSSIAINARKIRLVNEVFDNTRLDANLVPTSYFERITNRLIRSNAIDWANNYTKNLAKKGSFISFDLNGSLSLEKIHYDILQTPSFSERARLMEGDTASIHQMPEKGTNYWVVFQGDYSYPINESNRVDLGVKASARNLDRDFEVLDYNFNSNVFQRNAYRSNHFVFNERLLSAYGIYNGRKGKWAYQAGARVEQALTTSDQRTTQAKYNYDYANIFPSAYLTYKPLPMSEWKATYSRRIVRPEFQNLNPFINYADRFNLRTGNPYIRPEYVNSYEIGHVLQLKKMSFNTTLYYRQSTGLIWRTRTLLSQGVSMVIFQNIPGSETKGLEAIHNWQIAKWWSLNNSFNLFQRMIFVGDVLPGQSNSTSDSWNWKLLSTFRPYKGTDLTVSYTYDSPLVTPQGKILPMYAMDISFKKDVFKKKASIGIRFSDVFNTRRFRMEMNTPQFTDNFMRKRESRNVFLTFTWRFGSEEGFGRKSEKRKGGLNSEAQGEDSM